VVVDFALVPNSKRALEPFSPYFQYNKQ